MLTIEAVSFHFNVFFEHSPSSSISFRHQQPRNSIQLSIFTCLLHANSALWFSSGSSCQSKNTGFCKLITTMIVYQNPLELLVIFFFYVFILFWSGVAARQFAKQWQDDKLNLVWRGDKYSSIIGRKTNLAQEPAALIRPPISSFISHLNTLMIFKAEFSTPHSISLAITKKNKNTPQPMNFPNVCQSGQFFTKQGNGLWLKFP